MSGTVHVKNDGPTATFNVSVTNKAGSPHTMTTSATKLTVPSRGERTFTATLTVPAATAGDTNAFRDVAGLITLTPAQGQNKGATLRVPYYLVPRVTSNVSSTLPRLTGNPPSGTVTTRNPGAIETTADFYAWGLTGVNDENGLFDVRAVGAQSFDAGGSTGQLIVFAVNTFRAWSVANTLEFDVDIDTNGDGDPDFDLLAIDVGLINGAGTFLGEYVTAFFDLHTGAGFFTGFDASAPTDSSTLLMPVFASDVGVTAATPRFSWTATSNNPFDSSFGDSFADMMAFNAFTPAITNGDFVTVQPNANQFVVITIDPTEAALTRSGA